MDQKAASLFVCLNQKLNFSLHLHKWRHWSCWLSYWASPATKCKSDSIARVIWRNRNGGVWRGAGLTVTNSLHPCWSEGSRWSVVGSSLGFVRFFFASKSCHVFIAIKWLDLWEALQSDRSKIKIRLIIYKVVLKSQLTHWHHRKIIHQYISDKHSVFLWKVIFLN